MLSETNKLLESNPGLAYLKTRRNAKEVDDKGYTIALTLIPTKKHAHDSRISETTM